MSKTANKNILELKNIGKNFTQGKAKLKVLNKVNLMINEGEAVALVGPSGCGKSTLLQIAGLLEEPAKGYVKINGQKTGNLSDKKRTLLRRDSLGFIYQQHHLLPEFTALENVILPQIIAGKSKSDATQKAEKLLNNLGLKKRLKHRPAELSGGEQQRVAIARSLANDPAILLADEPTGNLDPNTADDVFNMLIDKVKSLKLALLLVTHNSELATRADKIMTIREGNLEKL